MWGVQRYHVTHISILDTFIYVKQTLFEYNLSYQSALYSFVSCTHIVLGGKALAWLHMQVKIMKNYFKLSKQNVKKNCENSLIFICCFFYEPLTPSPLLEIFEVIYVDRFEANSINSNEGYLRWIQRFLLRANCTTSEIVNIS